VHVRQIDGGTDEVAGFRQRGIETERPSRALAVARDIEHGVDGQVCRDLPGIVPAHAVGDHTQPERLVDREAILVGGPDCAPVGDTARL
jgi:hypothetical protein